MYQHVSYVVGINCKLCPRKNNIEPFYSTKEAGKGTGLGFFIIHSMKEHGGKIEVKSKRGHGATFILRLPAV